MASVEDFITKFHSLSGVTIGERRKNLFLLLKGYNKQLEWDFTLLQPKNFLEEKFKVDVLIYFRRVRDLIEILKSEKPFLINQILKKNVWFIQELCKISAEELISLIFPNISFKIKIKIVNNLAIFLNDADQAADYFEAIRNKYGFYLAAKLLPSCSSDFIINFLTTHKFTPTGKQVLLIIKRYPQLSEEIFDIILNKVEQESYGFIFQHIAKYDFELFIKLNEKYNLRVQLGWRLTEKYVRLHEQEVITNPEMYYLILHNRTIAKTLNKKFSSLFVHFFPETLEEFRESYRRVFSILKNVPARQNRLKLLQSAFENLYGCSFWHDRSLLTVELMDMLPMEERHKHVSVENTPDRVKEEIWVSYQATSKSLPHIKHKISLSSAMQTRAQLVNYLVLTCKLNCDTVALLEVCNYMLNKHRNDNVKVRENFLNSLTRHFKLEELSEEHWNAINKLVDLSYLNNENPGQVRQFKEAYIHYRLIHNLPIRDNLLEWIRFDNNNMCIIESNLQFSKLCLLMFGEIINEMEDEKLQTWSLRFIESVARWNGLHPKDYISVFKFDKVGAILKERFSTGDYNYKDIELLFYCIQHEPLSREVYFNIYLSLLIKYGQYDILSWLMQNDVSFTARNIDAIGPLILEDSSSFRMSLLCKHARNLSHLNIPQKITSICMEHFRTNKSLQAVVAMSFLKDPFDFVELLREHYPIERQADYKTPEGRELYALQEAIGKSLKNLNPPSAALESILMFCKGDFLKLVLSSLYSVSDNVNETKLPPFFSELITRAVSTRKHALHLTFRVLDKTKVYTIIKRFMEKEKNLSLRKFIFKICFNFFITNPEEFTWELVTLNLTSVDIDDREAVEILLQIDKVPPTYIVPYISLVWNTLHSRSDLDNRWECDKLTVLRSISPSLVPKISDEFFKNVIDLYFLKSDTLTHFTSTINVFVCKYILYCDDKNEKRKRLSTCFDILREYVLSSWNDPKRRSSARNTAIDFLKEFCNPFLSSECVDKEIFTEFWAMWKAMLKPQETFDEDLHLKFTYFTMEMNDLQNLALELRTLCDTLVSDYGQVVIGMICKKINFFSPHFFKNDNETDLYSLILFLIQEGSSVTSLILAIFLLNNLSPTKLHLKKKYNSIIEQLEKSTEPVVQMYLCSHIAGNTNLFYA